MDDESRLSNLCNLKHIPEVQRQSSRPNPVHKSTNRVRYSPKPPLHISDTIAVYSYIIRTWFH